MWKTIFFLFQNSKNYFHQKNIFSGEKIWKWSYLWALLKALCLAVNLRLGFRKLSVLSMAFSNKTSVVSVIFAGVTDEGLFRILFFRTNFLKISKIIVKWVHTLKVNVVACGRYLEKKTDFFIYFLDIFSIFTVQKNPDFFFVIGGEVQDKSIQKTILIFLL